MEALGLGKKKIFLFKRRFPVLTGFHFMAMVLFSKPHYTYQQISFLSSLTVLIKSRSCDSSACWLSEPGTRGKTRCQLTMGAENSESKYSHCTEQDDLKFCPQSGLLLSLGTNCGNCYALVFLLCPQHWQLERKLLIAFEVTGTRRKTATKSPKWFHFFFFVLCWGRFMSTGSGSPASEKEAASGNWHWSMEHPGPPPSRPRQISSSGASTETATDAF